MSSRSCWSGSRTLTNLAWLTGDDDGDWLKVAEAAEQKRAALQARLDEVIAQYAAGESEPRHAHGAGSRRCGPSIAEAEQALIPPVTDERVRALVTAEDAPAAWAGLPPSGAEGDAHPGHVQRPHPAD